MNTLFYAFGVHCHQPYGNFDHVFEAAYKQAYKPFLNELENHPGFRISYHCSGTLFEWFEENQPDIIDQMARLLERNQLELLTGAYYEPILSMISEVDIAGQIQKQNDYLKRRFGVTPKGMWVPERVWEPQHPRPLTDAGIEYVILDDAHLRCAGLSEKQTFGYYMTDDLGASLAVFPINQTLRYAIPFHDVDETIDYLYHLAAEGQQRCVVFADDCEKFGIWPGTNKHCYVDGWLERYMSTIERQSDWIEMITFSEALGRLKPLGRVDLPTAAYEEMMEWALPSSTSRAFGKFIKKLKELDLYEENWSFVRGGFWRSFLTKYEEANHLHKRMIGVSRAVNDQLSKKKSADLETAREHVWRGQGNCAYWHGAFGGLYLPHLRHSIYQQLTQAEEILGKVNHRTKSWIEVGEQDFNADGLSEIIVSTPLQQLFFSPLKGAALLEHDYFPASTNLINSLRRRDEAYHDRIKESEDSDANGRLSIHEIVTAKESKLDKLIYHDRYGRYSLIDHFFDPGTEVEGVRTNRYEERGSFINASFDLDIKKSGEAVTLIFSNQGSVHDLPVYLEKRITIPRDGTKNQIRYFVENRSNQRLQNIFGIEFNVNLLAGNAADRYYFIAGRELQPRHLASIGEVNSVQTFGMKDHWMNLRIMWTFDRPIRFWRFPIETVSLSEAGFERIFQGSVLLPNLDLVLEAGRSLSITCELEVASAED